MRKCALFAPPLTCVREKPDAVSSVVVRAQRAPPGPAPRRVGGARGAANMVHGAGTSAGFFKNNFILHTAPHPASTALRV